MTLFKGPPISAAWWDEPLNEKRLANSRWRISRHFDEAGLIGTAGMMANILLVNHAKRSAKSTANNLEIRVTLRIIWPNFLLDIRHKWRGLP
jgi:hypothetical protein